MGTCNINQMQRETKYYLFNIRLYFSN